MKGLRFSQQVWKDVALLALAAAVVLLAFGRNSDPAAAAPGKEPAGETISPVAGPVISAPGAAAGKIWVYCTPVEIAAIDNRISLKCSESYGKEGIRFFASSTKDAASAARYLSVITTAQVAGRTLSVLYDHNDESGADFNCSVSNCRRLYGVGFGQ